MMDTVSEIINKLRKEGYTEDFNLQPDCLECDQNKTRILNGEFIIDKFYRFEGDSNPDDEATVYAIASPKHGIKGILVNGGGIYTDDIPDEMLQSLKIKKQ